MRIEACYGHYKGPWQNKMMIDCLNKPPQYNNLPFHSVIKLAARPSRNIVLVRPQIFKKHRYIIQR